MTTVAESEKVMNFRLNRERSFSGATRQRACRLFISLRSSLVNRKIFEATHTCGSFGVPIVANAGRLI